MKLGSIHHVTAIAGDPQVNLDFYTGVLGLRLVKQTVNYDDPGSYHFYYGNAEGEPGTILTFFPWPGAARGRNGDGQVTSTALSVPAGSLAYWNDRLTSYNISVGQPVDRFGDSVLLFVDPDGLVLELVEDGDDQRVPWTEGGVDGEYAIRGLHHVTMTQAGAERSATFLELLGSHPVTRIGERSRFDLSTGGAGGFVDIVHEPNAKQGRIAAGTVHHVAFRTPDDGGQLDWLAFLREHGVGVSDVRDRQYFRSIYFREPGGVLYEIATDTPGFLTDESREDLGTGLKLPTHFEPYRAAITAALPRTATRASVSTAR